MSSRRRIRDDDKSSAAVFGLLSELVEASRGLRFGSISAVAGRSGNASDLPVDRLTRESQRRPDRKQTTHTLCPP